SGKQIQCLEGHSNCVNSVQFSPDGTRIVSGSEDSTIRLWDAFSGKQIQCLEDHSNNVTSVQFSPDGTKIVSGSWDDTIRLSARFFPLSSSVSDITDNLAAIRLPSNDSEERHTHSLNNNGEQWRSIWQGGSCLSLKGSVWKDTKGLTSLQMSVVESYGGTF
ncbi:hypothetical protein RFI_25235, partial [Reticulomyxa filosa]